MAIAVVLPFLGARIVYTIVGTFDHAVNLCSGPIALRLVLVALMEYIVAIVLAAGGVMTRNIFHSKAPHAQDDVLLEEQPAHRSLGKGQRK